MFSASELFHFVFANMNDEYYTSSLVKMDFDTYLWYCLRTNSYKYIAHIIKVPNSSEYVMELTNMSLKKTENTASSSGFWGSFSFFSRNNNDDMRSKEHFFYEHDSNVCREKSSAKLWDDMQEGISEILEFMKTNSSVAFVMHIDEFDMLCKNRDNMAKLVAMKKDNHSNIIVLCGSVDAAENDKYFVESSHKYNSKNQYDANDRSIFFERKLFPELLNEFRPADIEKLPKMVITYALLKKALGDRMMVWNEFSYDKVLDVVRYKFLRARKEEMAEMYPPEFAAFAVQAWYGNYHFRSKYKEGSSVLDGNRTRRFSSLAYDVGKRGFMRWLREIYLSEKTYDIYELKKRWMIDESYSYIGYFSESHSDPAIVQQMLKYREILLQQRYDIGKEKMDYIISMIKFFRQPSYVSSNNKADLPHHFFENPKYAEELNKLYTDLSRKGEWNKWDDCCIEVLFALFDLCKDHAESCCGNDSFNETGELQVEQGMELIKYCRKQSVDRYFDYEQACRTCNEAVDILYSGDKSEIKTIRLIYCI